MTTPPKCEDLYLKIAELERRESDLMEKIARAGRVSFSFFEERDALQQRLTVAEQRAVDMVYALARIQGRAEMFIDDGMHMPTPSIEAIRDIAAKAALKQVEDAKSSPSCPNCKVCMESPDFPENCLIKGASHDQ